MTNFLDHHLNILIQSLMKVRPKVKRIVGLTGTPGSNGLMDLWAEFRLLDIGKRLGRFIGQYRTDYFLPDKRNGQVIFSYKPLSDAEERIYEKISDITISMKSADHLQMPELVKHDLERISERLKTQHIPFAKLDTSDSIARWNHGELLVALIHPASAGHGLNLQSAATRSSGSG